VFIHFSPLFLYLVTSMMELLDSLVILQVECQQWTSKYFWNQNVRSIFQNSNRERDQLCLWDHTGL
jgi:hypothetical protein